MSNGPNQLSNFKCTRTLDFDLTTLSNFVFLTTHAIKYTPIHQTDNKIKLQICTTNRDEIFSNYNQTFES